MRISDWSSDVCSSDLDLDRAVALSGGTERGARLDRLKLLGIADQHDLGALLLGFGHDTLKLARPDHASLVDDEDMFARPPLAVIIPLMLEAGERPRADARHMFYALRCAHRQNRTLHLLASGFPSTEIRKASRRERVCQYV